MKANKSRKSFLLIILFLLFTRTHVYSQSAQGIIPQLNIDFNGVLSNNEYLKTPLLSYKNITYIPISKEISSILGLQIVSGENERYGDNSKVIFIGTGNRDSKISKLEVVKKKNPSRISVEVVSGYIFINSLEDYSENIKEKYPILMYKDTYYMPLTWHIGKELLNWNIDSKNGNFKIDSTQTIRPLLDGTSILNTSIGAGLYSKGYLFTENAYIAYPLNTMNLQYEFFYKVRGQEDVRFSLEDSLKDADYYFGSLINENGVIERDPNHLSKLENNTLTLACAKIYLLKDQIVQENKLIQINLLTQKVIKETSLPCPKVKQ